MTPRPLVLQVGAHRHAGPAGHDPVRNMIEEGGYDAILIEPLPFAAAELRTRYAQHPGVRVVEAAVCPGRVGRRAPLLFYLNGTSTLGSNTSDIRCLGRAIKEELASLSKMHVLRHQRFYRPHSVAQCRRCSERLGRPLPTDCMRDVIVANMQLMRVRCTTLATELPRVCASHGATRVRAPDVLVIDAEGYDCNRTEGLAPRAPSSLVPFPFIFNFAPLRTTVL